MHHPEQLSRGAINQMISKDQGTHQDFIVHVLNVTSAPNKSRLTCTVTDGTHLIKAFVESKRFPDSDKLKNSIIMVLQHLVLPNIGLSFQKLDILGHYDGTIGSPADFFKNFQQGPTNADIRIIAQKFTPYLPLNNKSNQNGVSNFHNVQGGQKIQNINKDQNRRASAMNSNQPNQQQNNMPRVIVQNISQEDMKQIETIRSFYSGIDNWQIVARIVKKDYRQFTNKKGKFTKVINIVLIDKSKMKIDGACFGDPATQYSNRLVQGQVYRISKGNVSQDDYYRSRAKGNDYSKYKILFNEKSVFTPVADLGIIPVEKDHTLTLKQFYDQKQFDQDFDIIGVITQIGDQVELNGKDGKQIKKKSLTIVDPQQMVSMQVIIWNQKPLIDQSYLNKTVILGAFRLKDYRDALSLNSNFRSTITIVKDHKYNKAQGNVPLHRLHNLSKRPQTSEEPKQHHIEAITNLKELRQKAKNLTLEDKAIRSDLNLWVNEFYIGNRKWFYEGCSNNKCKKAATSGQMCDKCGGQVKDTIPHFIMGVELSDQFGSIQVTAYDDFAQRFLTSKDKYADSPQARTAMIRQLDKMGIQQRKKFVSQHLYQQFRMVVFTGNQGGYIKHKIGKIFEIPAQKIAQANLVRIKQFI